MKTCFKFEQRLGSGVCGVGLSRDSWNTQCGAGSHSHFYTALATGQRAQLKTVGARRTPANVVRMHKSENATDAHNLDSTKPANVEPEVEIGEFEMGFLDVDALPATMWKDLETSSGRVW